MHRNISQNNVTHKAMEMSHKNLLVPIKSIYLINNTSSQDPLQYSQSIYTHHFYWNTSVDFLSNSHVIKLAPLLAVTLSSDALNYLLLTQPAQVTSRALPRLTSLLILEDEIMDWRHFGFLLQTDPFGSSPTTKIISEHEVIHRDIKTSLKCSKIRPSQYYCYYNKTPALSNFRHHFSSSSKLFPV